MPQRSRREADMDALSFRELSIRESTVDVETRSVRAVVATEAAVPMPDWQRMEMVPEVLLMSGAEFPKSRQVPLLDSHDRHSVGSQLGSVRDLAIEGDRMTGRPVFSETAVEEFTKVREGHVTDVSVGYSVSKRTYIPEGKSKEIGGRTFSGPLNVVSKWRVLEVSVTPIGADQQAKMRGLSPCLFSREKNEEFAMNDELRALLVSRGMPAELNDTEAQKWLMENRSKLVNEPKPESIPITTEAMRKAAEEAAMKVATKAIEDERKRRDSVRAEADALCKLAGLAAEVARTFYELADVAAVRAAVQKAKEDQEKNDPPLSFRITGDGRQRFVADLGTALQMRAAEANCAKRETLDKVVPVESRSKGYESFRHATLFDMAREWVQQHGVETRGLTREQVAICALFGPERAGIRSNAGYHTTGSFANLTLDAINKAMMVGYTEAPSTWERCFRRASSVPDFKTINRVRMGAIPNLPVWPDNKDPESASLADARESYAVESRSYDVSFSYKLIVNDDMDAISRTPAMLGQAARRTVNAVAWAVPTANPTMSDGVALFAAATGARKRTNLTTGAGAPSVSTVQTLTNLMAQMRGENTPVGAESDDILSLQPTYIVGPSALSTTIAQLVNSAFDPSSSVNHQVYNPTRVLEPIIEPLLDASSTTAWYLFASPAQIDTVEVTFLQGQENPVVRDWMDQKTLAMHYTVLQTYAAKAMNHRGMQKHAGA